MLRWEVDVVFLPVSAGRPPSTPGDRTRPLREPREPRAREDRPRGPRKKLAHRLDEITLVKELLRTDLDGRRPCEELGHVRRPQEPVLTPVHSCDLASDSGKACLRICRVYSATERVISVSEAL